MSFTNVKIELDDNILLKGKTYQDIAYAVIKKEDCDTFSTESEEIFILKPGYTTEELDRFLEDISRIEYDNGFGIQELFGYVVFKDSTWLERAEYDGSEWWEAAAAPKFEDIAST